MPEEYDKFEKGVFGAIIGMGVLVLILILVGIWGFIELIQWVTSK